MTSPHLLWLLAGVGTILILASVIGEILRARLSPAGENPVIENLNARINAWWVMVICLALAFIAGKPGVVLLFALCSFAALREFLTLTTHNRADHWSLVACFFVILPLQYWFLATWNIPTSYGITVDTNGHVYITDYAAQRVLKQSSNGLPLSNWGTPGVGNGQFASPFGVAANTSALGHVQPIHPPTPERFHIVTDERTAPIRIP